MNCSILSGTKLIVLTFLMLSSLNILKSQHQKDTSVINNFFYKKVIFINSEDRKALEDKAVKWLNQTYKKSNKVSETDSSINLKSEGKFLVYTKGMISKEIHGAIKYDINIVVHNNKYAYTYDNFLFAYYKQNRQYEYVPTGKIKSLKELSFPGWQGAWNRYKTETKAKVEQEILNLENTMSKK